MSERTSKAITRRQALAASLGTAGIAAVGGTALNGAIAAGAYAAGDADLGRVGIFRTSVAGAPQYAAPDVLEKTIRASGRTVVFLSDKELCEPERLLALDLLILPSGSSMIPPSAMPALNRYCTAGGSFLIIGDTTFGDVGYDRLNAPEKPRYEFTWRNPVRLDLISFFTHHIAKEGVARVVAARDQSVIASDFGLIDPGPCSVLPGILDDANLRKLPVPRAMWMPPPRWMPLLRAYDANGREVGPVAAILLTYGSAYKNAAFAYWGLMKERQFEEPVSAKAMTVMVDILLKKTSISDFLAEEYYVRPGEETRLEAKVTNRGRWERKARAVLAVKEGPDSDEKEVASEEIALAPGETRQLDFTWRCGDTAYREHEGILRLSDDGGLLDTRKTQFVVREEIILSVDDAEFLPDDAWRVESNGEGPKVRVAAGVAPGKKATARWTPDIRHPGHYDVFARWTCNVDDPPDTGRARNAPYVVHSAAGKETVRVGQRWVSGAWVYLGTFEFEGGRSGSVELSNDADGSVCADAIRFAFTDTVPPPSHGRIRVDANHRYFEFADGKPFMPVGLNFHDVLSKASNYPSPEAYISRYFSHMQKYGLNVLRLWLHPGRMPVKRQPKGRLFRPGPPEQGHGPIDQEAAQRMHYVLYAARKCGIYLNPVAGDLTSWKVRDEVMLRRWQFLTEEFGRGDQIFSWDMANDYQVWWREPFLSDYSGPLRYLQMVSGLVRGSEAPPHLVNLQYGGYQDDETVSRYMPTVVEIVDFTTVRSYPHPGIGNDPEEIVKLLHTRIVNQLRRFPKPIIVGEYGALSENRYFPNDERIYEKTTKLGSWVALASGSCPVWRWMPATRGEYEAYAAVSRFCKRVEWNKFDSVNADKDVEVAESDVRVMAIRDNSTLLALLLHDDPDNDFHEVEPEVQISTGLRGGPFHVEWIDPDTGTPIRVDGPARMPLRLRAPTFREYVILLVRLP